MDLPESAFDAAGAAVCVFDPEGRVVRWTLGAAALTGISSDEIEGHIFEPIPLFPDDMDRWKSEFDRIGVGSGPRHFETRWRIHDGSADNARYIVCTVMDSLSRELMAGRTTEFRDLARFLHDTISQDLVALSYNVSSLETTAMDQPARTHTRAAVDLVDRCCRFIRTMSFMLAPPSPPETTLEESLRQYADYVREETGLAVTVVTDPVPTTLPLETQSLFFAAVQKWIAQGLGIRGKAAISIRIGTCGAGTVLEMEAVSNASAPIPHTGWALIRERTRALGGEFNIGEFDIAGDSTRARISLPD